MDFFNPSNNQNQFKWLTQPKTQNNQNQADTKQTETQGKQDCAKNPANSESNKSSVGAYFEASKQLAEQAKKDVKQMKTKLFSKMQPTLKDFTQTRKAVKNCVKEEFENLNEETADYLTDMTLQHRMDLVGLS